MEKDTMTVIVAILAIFAIIAIVLGLGKSIAVSGTVAGQATVSCGPPSLTPEGANCYEVTFPNCQGNFCGWSCMPYSKCGSGNLNVNKQI